MGSLKNLAEVSKEEQSKFFKSFDHVLTDMDGVIWQVYNEIPGSKECIDSLKGRGKRVRFVTNNPLVSGIEIWKKLVRAGFNAEIEDVASPVGSLISYLEDIKFKKKLFVIGTNSLKEELRKANFEVAPEPPSETESLHTLIENIGDDEDIGAIIFSWDLNMTYLKLQKALTYLKRKECLFIVTLPDKKLEIGSRGPLIGTGPFIEMLTDFSGKEPVITAKPSNYFAEFISKKYGVMNSKRVLFIGDQIDTDMKFANIGSYQKLLVLTGLTKIEHIRDWQFPEEYKPEYYVESLKVLNDILKST
ncbi:uncharacterized protein [Leptinotarsa decemlineata]|uniref:uncharacterized protein n=1 Tax=Leptinotarsa decemlineata TaxID=7539 RepID=UPI003D30AD7D